MAKFADATRAHEWIHVDVERARRESPFGTTVVHGYLTLSLATAFVTELLALPGDRYLGINHGLERVRFPAPFPVGGRVRAHGTLTEACRHDQGVRTLVDLTYEQDGSDVPPCVASVVSLVVPAGEVP